MPLDLDLQLLRRRVTEAPHDGAAWLALASGLERCGARDDAVETFYRARALDAEADACRTSLQRLGATPSPWTHPTGDSERTFSAPVRGPSRGKVVLRRDLFTVEGGSPPKLHEGSIVCAPDGCVVAGRFGSVVHLEPTRFLPRSCWDVAPGASEPILPTVASDGVILGVTNGRSRLYARLADETVRALDPPDRFQWGHAMVDRAGTIAALTIGAGATVYSRGLELVRQLPWPPSEAVFLDSTLALSNGRRPLYDGRTRELVLMDLEGRELFRRSTLERPNLAFLGDGSLVLVSGERYLEGPLPGWLQFRVDVVDPEGTTIRSLVVGDGTIPSQLSVSLDGAIWLGAEGGLTRIGPGAKGWWTERDDPPAPSSHVITDRAGVGYYLTGSRLVARAPDGGVVFRVDEELSPVAIDALGRLLVLGRREARSASGAFGGFTYFLAAVE